MVGGIQGGSVHTTRKTPKPLRDSGGMGVPCPPLPASLTPPNAAAEGPA